ncbi:MAG: beta-galactosidase, partial [Planctomycetes bacterium]|nr:beta-galactosidase [Planctomycetota bacterium]
VWRAPAVRWAAPTRSEDDGIAVITAAFTLDVGQSHGKIEHRVAGDGTLAIDYTFEPEGDKLPELPRVGLCFEVPRDYRQVGWFGRGPHENYADRKSGAFFGIYHLPVAGLNHPYIEPQEHGNRCDVRWLELRDDNGNGLRVRNQGAPFAFSVWPHTQAALEAAAHPFEVEPGENLTVNLDAGQTGVGGDNSWGARPHPEYTLTPTGQYRLRVVFEPAR